MSLEITSNLNIFETSKSLASESVSNIGDLPSSFENKIHQTAHDIHSSPVQEIRFTASLEKSECDNLSCFFKPEDTRPLPACAIAFPAVLEEEPVIEKEEGPFSPFEMTREKWISQYSALKEQNTNPIATEMTHEVYTDLQQTNLRYYVKEETDEITSSELETQVTSFDRYLIAIKEIEKKAQFLEKKLKKFEDFFAQELKVVYEKFPPKVAKKFEEKMQNQLQKIRNIPKEKIDDLVFKAFTHFYINTLDSYPNLHPDFKGFIQEKQLYFFSSDILCFLNDNKNLNENYKKVLIDCVIKLKEARFNVQIDSSYNKTLNGKSTPGEKKEIAKAAKQTAKHMEKKVQSLQVGESCIFRGAGKVHAILYEVVRISENSFTFTIINTGDDEPTCFSRRPKGLSGLFVPSNEYAHKAYVVPAGVLNVDFLSQIVPSVTSEALATPELVKKIDEYLTNQMGVQPCLGRLHQPQERGNCAAKSIASWLKGELIRQLGKEEGSALYSQLKSYRAESNYAALLKLKGSIASQYLKKVYSQRTYKEKKDPYEDSKLIKEIPASEAELANHFTQLHKAANEVIGKLNKKAEKSRTALK